MKLLINGEARSVVDGTRLGALLEELGLDRRFLVVERNGEPVPRAAVAEVVLEEGDRLELVRPVAGG